MTDTSNEPIFIDIVDVHDTIEAALLNDKIVKGVPGGWAELCLIERWVASGRSIPDTYWTGRDDA